jgi:oligopeptide/dipeptide ABC transporter ATP-binding protein
MPQPDVTSHPLLEVQDLVVSFRRRGLRPGRSHEVRAVDGLSLSVWPGETLAIVGESGSGKSTLARSIVRLVRPQSGRLMFGGQDLAGLRESAMRPLRRRIQMVFQDSLSSLNPRRTVGSAVAEAIVVHDLRPRPQVPGRVAELLEMVGLRPDLAARRPSELSGGQRQRINIARALACEPDLIIADEPTSALDVSIRAQMLNLLRGLQRDQHLTYLFISHDLTVVRQVSTRVAVMYLGRVVESGAREELYRSPRHPYTRALLAAAPVADPALQRARRNAHIPGEVPSPANPPSGCVFHPRCPMAVARCSVEAPKLRQLERAAPGHAAACHFAD